MFGKKNKVDLTKVNSLIAKGMKITGTVEFQGTLKISGFVQGIIKPNDGEAGLASNGETVIIIEGTVISSSVVADHIVITGKLNSEQVIATKSLIVISGGKLFSDDAKYGSLTIDDSAVVTANLAKITEETTGLTVEA